MRQLGRIARARLLIGASATAILFTSGSALAQDRPVITIAPQPLAAALYEFGGKTGTQVIFPSSLAAAKRSGGVAGESDERLALSQLLAGTNLSFRREGDVFVIVQQEGGGSPQDGSAAGGGAEVEALVVTAQKKEEAIQDVPIAISAFTQKSLDAQKIEGGFDLLKAIPNVTFSKNNFSGYNFSIRGIGTKAVSATTDPGVAVSFNNTTLIVNRLFEQEYYDVERVEVLRGPQGTLYGRNATSGVINVLSARPRLGEFEGDIKFEAGNYNAQRVRGMINVPVGDTVAVRLAGAMTKRDGYGINAAAEDPEANVEADVDDRDLWSARVTVGWEPIDSVRVNALWERFEEDDRRVRTSKQLCHNDPGPDNYPNFSWEELAETTDPTHPAVVFGRAATSQGCLPGSLYDEGAYGTPNGASLPFVSGLFWATFFSGFEFGSNYYGLGPNIYFPGHIYYQVPFGGTPPPAPCEGVTFSSFTYPLNLCQADPYGGLSQVQDLRTIHSLIEPKYRANADIFELSIDIDVTDNLTFTSQTVYNEDEYYATQDYNRFTTLPVFNDSSMTCGVVAALGNAVGPCPAGDWVTPFGTLAGPIYAGGFYNVTPGGVFTDPQLGPSNTLVGQDLSQATSEQFNQEFRLVSNFDAPLNFSLGTNFTRFETLNDYYVFLNTTSFMAHLWPFNTHVPFSGNGCGNDTTLTQAERNAQAQNCTYIDPNPLESINGEGHNYFRSANPYQLTSSAVFGELYWQATETLKVTLGARMTWDRKVFTPRPSQFLLFDYRNLVPEGAGPLECTSPYCKLAGTGVGGRGNPSMPDIVQEWREPTGRIIVDWKPDLAFTDESMLYASYSHGYKGGGANPPGIAAPAGLFNARNSAVVAPPTFQPEFIDAFEVGSKNTLLDGGLILNGSAFYYAYEEYQVSKIVDRSAANENFDARLWGLELEWIFSPTRNLRFNGTLGYLNTEIGEGERSIDLMDRTLGGNTPFTTADGITYSGYRVVKPWVTNSSNCVVPVEVLDALFASSVTGALNSQYVCPGGTATGLTYVNEPVPGLGRTYNPATEAPNGGAGFFTELGGNDLPNAPHWTMSLGAQYRFALPFGWDGTARVDHYWQDESYARVYNTEYDRLRSWQNTNLSIWLEQPDWGVKAEVYVKNAFDEELLTDAFLNSDDSGLTTNVFTLDPRLIGVSVTKSF